MAIPTNAYTRFDAVGVREALSDIIYNISPEDTPLMSNSGRESVKNTFYEWQTDALGAASTSNAQIEGDDITSFTAVVPTVRLGNYTQISRKDISLSGTLEAVDKAGRKSELTYQMAMRSAELKLDMETIALSNQARAAGNTTTARKTASILAYLTTNTDIGTGSAADPVGGDGTAARTDGTQRAFTETILKNVVQQMWTTGAKVKLLMVGAWVKQVISGFAGIADIRYNAQGNKPTTIIGAADVYVSDFGNLSVVPNRNQRGRDALFIDPEHFSFVYLRPFFKKELASIGDNEKHALYVEWGTKVKTEKAHGGAFDLSTS